MSAFSDLASLLIYRKFSSLRAFIRMAESGLVDSGAGYLSKVLRDEAPVPLQRVEAWADALGLTEEDRERFIIYASITHLPEMVQPRFVKLYDSYEKLTRGRR